MYLRVAVVLLVSLLPCQFVGAAPPKVEPKWAQEPSTVLGIELGAPLSGAIPVCQPLGGDAEVVIGYRPSGGSSTPRSMCRVQPDAYSVADVVQFRYFPLRDLLSSVEAYMHQGVVSRVQAELPNYNYPELRAVLIERYGQPTSTETLVVRTNAGAEWSSELLTWSGATVTIQLREMFDTIEKSAMFVRHLPTEATKYTDQQEKVKQAASEL